MKTEEEQREARNRFAAIALALGYEFGGAKCWWPDFAEDLVRASSTSPRLTLKNARRWIKGDNGPDSTNAGALRAALTELATRRNRTFRVAWIYAAPDEIVREAKIDVEAYRLAKAGMEGAEPPLLVALPTRISPEVAQRTRVKYHKNFHVFRMDETRCDRILHNLLAIGPDLPSAPGVAEAIMLERYFLFRGFVVPSADELHGALFATGEAGRSYALLLERRTSSKSAFAGAIITRAEDRKVMVALRGIFVPDETIGLSTSDSNDAAMRLRDAVPEHMDPDQDLFAKLRPFLLGETEQPANGAARAPHALWIDGKELNEKLSAS